MRSSSCTRSPAADGLLSGGVCSYRAGPQNGVTKSGRVFIGADGPWWRQFRGEGERASLLIRGRQHTGLGRAILDDPAYVAEVFARLRPDVPPWLPDWLNATLVVVELDS